MNARATIYSYAKSGATRATGRLRASMRNARDDSGLFGVGCGSGFVSGSSVGDSVGSSVGSGVTPAFGSNVLCLLPSGSEKHPWPLPMSSKRTISRSTHGAQGVVGPFSSHPGGEIVTYE